MRAKQEFMVFKKRSALNLVLFTVVAMLQSHAIAGTNVEPGATVLSDRAQSETLIESYPAKELQERFEQVGNRYLLGHACTMALSAAAALIKFHAMTTGGASTFENVVVGGVGAAAGGLGYIIATLSREKQALRSKYMDQFSQMREDLKAKQAVFKDIEEDRPTSQARELYDELNRRLDEGGYFYAADSLSWSNFRTIAQAWLSDRDQIWETRYLYSRFVKDANDLVKIANEHPSLTGLKNQFIRFAVLKMAKRKSSSQ